MAEIMRIYIYYIRWGDAIAQLQEATEKLDKKEATGLPDDFVFDYRNHKLYSQQTIGWFTFPTSTRDQNLSNDITFIDECNLFLQNKIQFLRSKLII